jgi:hypothetical protein
MGAISRARSIARELEGTRGYRPGNEGENPATRARRFVVAGKLVKKVVRDLKFRVSSTLRDQSREMLAAPTSVVRAGKSGGGKPLCARRERLAAH